MISEVLLKGAANAQTGREICRLLNITGRELTQAVERERRAGAPICAVTGTTKGYFLAATKEEMKQYCNSLLRRAGEICKTRAACIKSMEQLPL